MFWGRERTAELKEILYGPHNARRTSINRLGNLITLSCDAHGDWNEGLFALKHISGGGYEMVLELEWLPDYPELSREGVCLDQPVENTSAPFLASHVLANADTHQTIYSGYQLDWPDRTIGLGPDRTGLICKQSGPKFWDRTVVRSHGPVQSKLSNGPVYIFWTGLFTVYKKFGTGLLTVRSFISRLNISVRS
jgi:hypothetical protein